MIILKILALAFISAVLCLTLRKEHPAYGFLVAGAGVICLLTICIEQLRPVILWLKTLSAYTKSQNISILLSVLCIALVSQLAADLCRDAGVAAAAYAVELCGRALALMQALPLAQSLISSFLSFLS